MCGIRGGCRNPRYWDTDFFPFNLSSNWLNNNKYALSHSLLLEDAEAIMGSASTSITALWIRRMDKSPCKDLRNLVKIAFILWKLCIFYSKLCIVRLIWGFRNQGRSLNDLNSNITSRSTRIYDYISSKTIFASFLKLREYTQFLLIRNSFVRNN